MKSLFFLSQFCLLLIFQAKELKAGENTFVKVAKLKQIETLSINKKSNTIFYFWAEWCPPCKKFGPIYKKIAKKLRKKNIVFYKVDVDEDKKTFKTYQKKNKIEGIPTVLLFNPEGVLLKKVLGYHSYKSLMKIIKKTLKES